MQFNLSHPGLSELSYWHTLKQSSKAT